MSRGNAPFPYLAPWSPLGVHTLACFARSTPGWTTDCPLVGVFGEHLTASVHDTSCGCCFLGREPWTSWVTRFSGSRSSRAVLLRIPSYLLCGLWSRYCRSLVFGLSPFSFARLGSGHTAWSFARRSCSLDIASTVDFLGFLRLVRPNLSPRPLPLLTVVVPRSQSQASTALSSSSALTGRRRMGREGQAPFSAASGGFGRSGDFRQGAGLKSF